jgi:hypothetical protein
MHYHEKDLFSIGEQNVWGKKTFGKITEGVRDCCLTPIQQLLSCIMARTS